MTKEHKELLYFGYGLSLISAFFGVGGWIKRGLHWPAATLLICCLIFVSVTTFNWRALRVGYTGWMKVAHLIGGIVTTVILTVAYFVIFTPLALVIHLRGRDHLNRQIDLNAESYWYPYESQKSFSKDCYLNQY